jgi:pimeloyl-ACP methyl ester carboxylesterase
MTELIKETFIDISGTKLYYAEKNQTANQTIFFLHGNSSSHETWEYQFNSRLLSEYRLVAFDLPAHGFSDNSDDYSLPGIARIMANAVVKLASNKPYMLVGVSLGTNIISESMAFDLFPNGIVLAGPCIINNEYSADKIMIPDTKIGVGFIDDPPKEDLLALNQLAYNYHDEKKAELFLKNFKSVKDGFRSKVGQTLADGNFNDQIELVKKKKIPLLVIFGKADPAIDPHYLDRANLPLWRDAIIKLEGAGHWVHLDEPEQFCQLLADFARDVL